MRSLRTGSCLALAALCLTLSARGAGLEKLVPGNSDAVAVLNIKQLLDSKLVKKYAEDQIKKALETPDVKKAIEITGLDPTKDIDTIVVALKIELPVPKQGAVVIRGKFDETKIKDTLEMVAKSGKIKLDTSKEGSLVVYAITPEKGEKGYLVFADKSTVVLSPVKEMAVEVASGKTGKLNAQLASALEKVTGKESFFAAFALTDQLKDALKANPDAKKYAEKVEAAVVNLTVTDSVALNVTVRTSDEETAAGIKFAVGTGLGLAKAEALKQAGAVPGAEDLVKELFEKNIKTVRDGANVTVSVNISAEMIEKIDKLAKDIKDKQ